MGAARRAGGRINVLRNLVARMSPSARAAVMSLLLPGLGQLYLGRAGRAVIWLGGLIAVYLIAGSREADRWIAPVLSVVLGVIAAADAVVIGRHAGRRP